MVWLVVSLIMFVVLRLFIYFELKCIFVLFLLRILNICFWYVFVFFNICFLFKGLCVIFLFVGLLIRLVKLLIRKIILWFSCWNVCNLLINIVWLRCRLGVVGLKFVLMVRVLLDFSFLIKFFLGSILLMFCLILVSVVC